MVHDVGIERIATRPRIPMTFREALQTLARLPKVKTHPSACQRKHPFSSMRQGYTNESYLKLIRRIRELLPEHASDRRSSVTPEKRRTISRNMALVREVRFESAFMFIYSERDEASLLDASQMTFPSSEKDVCNDIAARANRYRENALMVRRRWRFSFRARASETTTRCSVGRPASGRQSYQDQGDGLEDGYGKGHPNDESHSSVNYARLIGSGTQSMGIDLAHRS